MVELSSGTSPHGLLRKDCLVVAGDGAGAPRHALAALADAARAVGGVRLIVGWSFGDWSLLRDREAFTSVRTVMGGYGMRALLREGSARYVPARLGAMPALLHGPLRPDVAVVSMRPGSAGFRWTSEVSWMAAAVDAAEHVVAEVNAALPIAGGEPAIDTDRIALTVEVDMAPPGLSPARLDDESRAIGEHVARLVPEGASVQFGPGKIGEAFLAALGTPVRVDSGVINDAVVDLDERGLLLGVPSTAYVVGTERVYRWADGRGVARRIEHTHDLTRLSRQPFLAVNTALEIDRYGQVNVERVGDDTVGGIGGHGDYAMAASRAPHGLSVIALPRERGGRPTLVDTLSAPASTGYADVDVVVCEAGVADLRGRDRDERARLIEELWSR